MSREFLIFFLGSGQPGCGGDLRAVRAAVACVLLALLPAVGFFYDRHNRVVAMRPVERRCAGVASAIPGSRDRSGPGQACAGWQRTYCGFPTGGNGQDTKPLQDSLADPQTTKRIDYLIDAQGHKKLRVRQTKLAAPTYLVGDGEPALLRLQQDTVFLLIAVPGRAYLKADPTISARHFFSPDRQAELSLR